MIRRAAKIVRLSWANLPLLVKGLVVVAVPLAALLLVNLTFYSIQRQHHEADVGVAHTFDVLREVQTSLALILTAEIATHDHALSGRKDWRELRERAVNALPKRFRRLEELLKGDDNQLRRLRRIEQLCRREFAEPAGSCVHDAAPRPAGHASQSQATPCHFLMEAIREELRTMRVEQHQLLLDRMSRVQRLHLQARKAMAAHTALGLLGGFLAVFLFVNGIVKRVRRLQRNAGRLEQGLPLLPTLQAGDEIGRLGEALESASLALRRSEEERKRAEQSIRESEQQLRTMFEEGQENLTARKQAEEELRWELSVTAALSELYKPLISPDSTIGDMAKIILDRALSLTASEHGYISSLDPATGNTIRHTSTNMLVDERAAGGRDKGVSLSRGPGGRYEGLRGHSLNTGEAFFTNAPEAHPAFRGTPDGHIPVQRFLSVPVRLDKELVGQIVLANAVRDYTKRELEAVRRLAEFYALAIQRKKSEDCTLAALREKEVLLREIHHRVKNNLQVISSLLNLQAGCVKDEHLLELLKDSQNRVRSMAMVHEQLHRSRDLSRIHFAEYVRSLTAGLFCSYGVHSATIALRVEVEDISLLIDTAIPCGLIVQELVANSLRHAFPKGRRGEIYVGLRSRRDGHLVLTVGDNGVGFPEQSDTEKAKSLGLRLVDILAEQINGTVERSTKKGTQFRIVFREPSLKEGNEK